MGNNCSMNLSRSSSKKPPGAHLQFYKAGCIHSLQGEEMYTMGNHEVSQSCKKKPKTYCRTWPCVWLFGGAFKKIDTFPTLDAV